jgi:hypothetical protein
MSTQPYPLDIYIDDLLEELNDDHDTDGVPLRTQARRRLMAVPPPLALAYADDVTALQPPRGLQHTIDAMARHGDLWKWNCNVVKSVCMVFGPPPAGLPPNGGGGGAYCRMWIQ